MLICCILQFSTAKIIKFDARPTELLLKLNGIVT